MGLKQNQKTEVVKMLSKIYLKKSLKFVLVLAFGMLFTSHLSVSTEISNAFSYTARLVRTLPNPHSVSLPFLEFLQGVAERIKNGEIPDIAILASIKSLGQGTLDIYQRLAQGLVDEHNNHPTQLEVIDEDPVIRHDIPGVLYLVEQYKDEFRKNNPLIYVSDGGFNSRAGVVTLAYGHQGPIGLPGNNTFRSLLFRLSMGLYESLSDSIKGNYMVWVASDNFLQPGNVNWNGRALSELPQDAKLILAGAKTQLLNANEMAEIKRLHENWDAISQKIKDENDSTFANFRRVVEREKIKELGVFTVGSDGKVSGFGEKIEDLGELAKFAYEKGDGAVYKNAFVNLVNKTLLITLQEELSEVESVNPKLINLSRYSLSWFQSVVQGRFVNEAEWIGLRINQIKPKTLDAEQLIQLEQTKKAVIGHFASESGIIQPSQEQRFVDKLMGMRPDFIKDADWKGLIDWVNYKRVLDEIISKEDLYAIDLDVGDGATQGFWYDAGNLEVLNDVLGSVVHPDLMIRNKARAVLGIPLNQNRVNLKLENDSEIKVEGINYYIENVKVIGGGTLIIEEGVVLKDVYLEIPAGETLTVTRHSKIIESDLRGVRVTFAGENGVINRYFAHGEEELIVRSFEWVISLKVGEEIITARNPILLPFKGKTIEQISFTIGEGILGKEAPEGQKIQMGWATLIREYPEYLGGYNFDEIKDKQFINLNNLAGHTFMDAVLKYIDFEWMHRNVNALMAIVAP